MKQSVTLLLINPENKVLLQLRDDKEEIPYPNTWCTPGGYLEEGESLETALKREIFEEIEYNLGKVSFIGKYYHKDIEINAFVSKTNIMDAKSFNLHEGQEVRFFSLEETKNIKTGFHVDEIIRDFFKLKN